MAVYVGIDEAGYGPMFGPMTIGCAAFRVPKVGDMWDMLTPAVTRSLQEAKKSGGLAIADSKQLTGRKDGLKPLALGCLSFAPGELPSDLGQWLKAIGTDLPEQASDMPLPWYADGPWDALPGSATAGEASIAKAMLQKAMGEAGIECLGLRASVVLEDRFNHLVDAMHNKALVSFHFIQQHLFKAWQAFGKEHVFVAIDRQGGRKDYRETLKWVFPEATLTEGEISNTHSGYRIEQGDRKLTVVFETKAEDRHLPVALASMTAKWTRELLMQRFNAYWQQHAPDVKPTKGYGTDGNRWWRDITPHLARLNVSPQALRRKAPGK